MLVAFISTTGISSVKEEPKFQFRWIYHILFVVAHDDKRNVEFASDATNKMSSAGW